MRRMTDSVYRQHAGASDASLSVVNQETDAKIAEIQNAFAQNKDKAVEKMLDAIINVQAKPHVNARAQKVTPILENKNHKLFLLERHICLYIIFSRYI